MVDRHSDPRTGGALSRLLRRASVSIAGTGHPVWGFCVVATRLSERRATATPARVLAPATGGRAGMPAAAGRPAPAGAAKLSRRDARLQSGSGAHRRAQGVEPSLGGDVIHDAAGGMGEPAGTLQRRRGSGDRHTDREPHPERDRAADRLLRQHPGPAHGLERGAEFPGTALVGCVMPAWKRLPIRNCRSSRWWSRWRSRAISPMRRCSR